jgi:hypothetical protein
MKIAVDLSWYNVLNSSQWDILASIVDAAIIRLSFGTTHDSMAGRHVEQCQAHGIPFAGYAWIDPTKHMPSHLDTTMAIIEKYDPAVMFLDFEQYWTDWAAYMRMDLAQAYATRFKPAQLEKYYFTFLEYLKSSADIPIGCYSADWFIEGYAPQMKKWVFGQNYWEARYFRYYDKAWWKNYQISSGIPIPIENVKEIAAHATIFKGIARQYESLMPLKGLPAHLDWNVIADDHFDLLFKGQPIPIPDPPPFDYEKYIVLETCWVRDAPNGLKVGYFYKNAEVLVSEIVDGWAHIETGWIFSKLLMPAILAAPIPPNAHSSD